MKTMSPKKLTEADKNDILKLYRHPEETTSTLASRYGVSNSTISRILKSNLPEPQYEALIQQKRLNRTPGGAALSTLGATELDVEAEVEPIAVSPTTEPSLDEADEADTDISSPSAERRRRKRSSASTESVIEPAVIQRQLVLNISPPVPQSDFNEAAESPEEMEQEQSSQLDELLDEDLLDLEDEDDVELDDDLEDEWEDEDDNIESTEPITTSFAKRNLQVQVLPLSEASFPKTCYLVVDRAAELIARPLKEFGDLGRIPADEVLEKTLPIFDNHKVARRFSNRSQRVIKVPDGRMLHKVRSHLQAKGITRLLIDGQVYSLSPTPLPT